MNSIECNVNGSVGAVLESNGEGDSGGELTVQLALSRASSDGAPANGVTDELRRDCIEQLPAHWQTQISL
jgi:hypothetical protein